MIEVLSSLVPTMEHAMQGSVVFAAFAHGWDVLARRYRTWVNDRKWAKQDAEWAAIAAATPDPVPTPELVALVSDGKKSKKNV